MVGTTKIAKLRKKFGNRLAAWNRSHRNAEHILNKQQPTDTEPAGYLDEHLETMLPSNLPSNTQEQQNQLELRPEVQPESEMSTWTEQEQQHQLHTDTVVDLQKERNTVIGRRIVDIGYFFEKIQEISRHSAFGCDIQCLDLIGEKQIGFSSKFTFLCRMCNMKFFVNSDGEHEFDINHAAVAGTIAIGCGHSQLEELASALNLPLITAALFRKRQEIVAKKWEAEADNSMTEAGQEEKALAIAEGRTSKDGLPLIDVVVDGCWSKRSYKKNYSALSGAAAIIGKRTKKILHLGVKNKYCSICVQAEKKSMNAKDHECFKNFEGSSTSMESEIIVEGFKQSIDRHGLIYGRLISDGDSSTYHKILDARPYDTVTVEKIECKNHLLRNLCNKLQNMQTDTKYLQKHRKLLTKKKILAIRCNTVKAIKHYSQKEDANAHVTLLFEDILLMHHHAFGDHSKCKRYFCEFKTQEIETPSDFFTSPLWQRISLVMGNFASHARSLIHNVDSNIVEMFHSIVAKFVGGKRVNYSLRRGYNTRCAAAAVSFNTKKALSTVIKSITGRSPRGNTKKFEERKLKRLNLLKKYNYKKKRLSLTIKNVCGDKNYGESSLRPDIPDDEMERLKKIFVENLKKTDTERKDIEKRTILQSSSSEWLELRRSLLTASNFGRIIKRRADTSCSNIVKALLYKATDLEHVDSIKHGREHEIIAIQQLEMQEKITIGPCGLFLDPEIPFLGASPDGICGDETIVEIKCPITAYRKGIDQAIREKKVNFWLIDKKGRLTVNKNHDWYYQIQGQLRITRKNICLLAVWFSEKEPLKTEIIYRDDEFFDNVMKPKLVAFYLDCVLPEIIDARYPRNMLIRDPQYILEAKLKKQNKIKSTVDAKNNKENENPTKAISDEPQPQKQNQPTCSRYLDEQQSQNQFDDLFVNLDFGEF